MEFSDYQDSIISLLEECNIIHAFYLGSDPRLYGLKLLFNAQDNHPPGHSNVVVSILCTPLILK